jgi:hypothetical protein
MKKFLLLPLLLCVTLNGYAATVTVDGTTYEVTAAAGSFNDLSAELVNQVWWNNGALAESFTNELRSQLGGPNPPSEYGPLFAYAPLPSGYVGYSWNGLFGVTEEIPIPSLSFPITFAVASPIPVPAAAWLFGSALLGLGVVKRRKA